jgi:hypothetical protein
MPADAPNPAAAPSVPIAASFNIVRRDTPSGSGVLAGSEDIMDTAVG